MDSLDVTARSRLRRADVAEWLRELADSLVEQGDLVVEYDHQRYGIDLPRRLRLTVDLDIETEPGTDAVDHAGVSISLRW